MEEVCSVCFSKPYDSRRRCIPKSEAKGDPPKCTVCSQLWETQLIARTQGGKLVPIRRRPTTSPSTKYERCQNESPCPHGSRCSFAHSEEELHHWILERVKEEPRLHPPQGANPPYQLCDSWGRSLSCPNDVYCLCPHSQEELDAWVKSDVGDREALKVLLLDYVPKMEQKWNYIGFQLRQGKLVAELRSSSKSDGQKLLDIIDAWFESFHMEVPVCAATVSTILRCPAVKLDHVASDFEKAFRKQKELQLLGAATQPHPEQRDERAEQMIDLFRGRKHLKPEDAVRELAQRGIIANAEQVVKLFQGRTINESDAATMIRELEQSGGVSNAEHIIDFFQKGFHKDFDVEGIVSELTRQGVAANMDQIVDHFQTRLNQGTDPEVAIGDLEGQVIISNAEQIMDLFHERFVEEMDSEAVVTDLEHQGIISHANREVITKVADKSQQNEILHGCMMETCTTDSLLRTCNIMIAVEGNPEVKALGQDIRRELEKGKRQVANGKEEEPETSATAESDMMEIMMVPKAGDMARKSEEYPKVQSFAERVIEDRISWTGFHDWEYKFEAEAVDVATGTKAVSRKYLSEKGAKKHARADLKAILVQKGIILEEGSGLAEPTPLQLPPIANQEGSGLLEPTPLQPPPITNQVNPIRKWTKGRLLGRGQCGGVFLCTDDYTGKQLAVKLLDIETSKPEAVKSLMTEIQQLKTLQHERIVAYFGSEQTEERLCIFLEYMPGGSVEQLLQRSGKLSEELTRRYTRQILEGVTYLHGRKIIHRDIKGGNILLNSSDNVKLADFGISKQLHTIATGFTTNSTKGTFYWMSPEVILGKPKQTTKVDIWSVGSTVVEMITGKPPLQEFHPYGAMLKIGHEPEKFLSYLSLSCSAPVKDFLSNCFVVDPNARMSADKLLELPFLMV